VLEQPLAFTTATLLALIRGRGGEPHVTLAAEPVWYDETAQRVLDAQVNAVLAERGLFGPGGMDRDLLVLIEAIARPEVEFYGWYESVTDGGSSTVAMYAGSGPRGAFVLVNAIDDDVVHVAPERPDELLTGFMNQVPACPPGAGERLVVGKGEFTTGRAPVSEDTEMAVMRSGVGRAVASPGQEIARIMRAPRTGAGTLYAAGRTRASTRHRCRRPVNFLDTAEGRWLMEEVPGRGEPLVVFTPATPQLLADRVRHAYTSLPTDRR
jgi:hypothetical protein